MEWHFLGIRLAAMRVTDLSTKLLPPGTLYSFTLSYFHYEFDTPAATCKNQDARIYRAFHSYPLLLFYLLHSCLPTYLYSFLLRLRSLWMVVMFLKDVRAHASVASRDACYPTTQSQFTKRRGSIPMEAR
jgi:hypothetical protein